MKNKDEIIYETKTFKLFVPEKPHIPRNDGGHIAICAKNKYFNTLNDLSIDEADELMWFTMLASQAYIDAMKQNGVNIARINYHEDGNWAFLRGDEPFMHVHIYGRTIDSKSQKWGQSLYFPDPMTDFYDNFERITQDDVDKINKQIKILLETEKYGRDSSKYLK